MFPKLIKSQQYKHKKSTKSIINAIRLICRINRLLIFLYYLIIKGALGRKKEIEENFIIQKILIEKTTEKEEKEPSNYTLYSFISK